MDTNEKMAVKIVRDCLTTAHESLPIYASCLYVASMPIIKAHGVDDATTRHMIVAAFRVAALRSRSVDYRSGFMPDVRVTRVHAFKRHAAVYCETNTGCHYKGWTRSNGLNTAGISSGVIMSISYDASNFTNVTNKHIL